MHPREAQLPARSAGVGDEAGDGGPPLLAGDAPPWQEFVPLMPIPDNPGADPDTEAPGSSIREALRRA